MCKRCVLLFTFQALNFNGRLKCLSLLASRGADGNTAGAQLALFAIATAVEPPSVMEIRTKTFIFQTKHRMDFAPLGVDNRWGGFQGQSRAAPPPSPSPTPTGDGPHNLLFVCPGCFQGEADFGLF